jgi:hypothetical protein
MTHEAEWFIVTATVGEHKLAVAFHRQDVPPTNLGMIYQVYKRAEQLGLYGESSVGYIDEARVHSTTIKTIKEFSHVGS